MKKAIFNAATKQTELVDMSAQEIADMEADWAANAPKADDVKAEARRRILARLPDWKQANMTARGVELLRKGEVNWTPQEQAEADAITAAWDWVKAIRLASDDIEAMTPIPDDYRDDGHWPSNDL